MEVSKNDLPVFCNMFCHVLHTSNTNKQFENGLTFIPSKSNVCSRDAEHGNQLLKTRGFSVGDHQNKLCTGCFLDVVNIQLQEKFNIETHSNSIFQRRLPWDVLMGQVSFLDQTLVTVEEAEEELAQIDELEFDEVNEQAYSLFTTLCLEKEQQETQLYSEIIKNMMQLLIVRLTKP
jgi:hypothetical protein